MSLTIVLAFSVRVSMSTFRWRAVPLHLAQTSRSETRPAFRSVGHLDVELRSRE